MSTKKCSLVNGIAGITRVNTTVTHTHRESQF